MEILRIQDGVREAAEREWFEEGVVRRVGNGMETLFWSDPWLGGVPLGERFQRLFDSSLHRACTVAEMWDLGWGEGGGRGCGGVP
jgi:hypothetical protein